MLGLKQSLEEPLEEPVKLWRRASRTLMPSSSGTPSWSR